MSKPKTSSYESLRGRKKGPLRGLQILMHGGLLRRVSACEFEVRSPVETEWQKVRWTGKAWLCTCKNERPWVCDHANAVVMLLRLPHIMTINLSPEQYECPRCGAGLDEAELGGTQRNKSGLVQRYVCQKCGYNFNERSSFERMKSNPTLIVIAVDLYYRGLSSREVCAHLRMMYSTELTHVTVYRWVAKYSKTLVELERRMLSDLKIGGEWHGDEVVERVAGKSSYIWGLLDARSRYLLACSLQSRRDTRTFKKVMSTVLEQIKKLPKSLTTDGLVSYKEGMKPLKGRVKHLAGNKFTDSYNNNLMERVNKTIRRRTKVAERWSNPSSASVTIDGYRMHYNLVRPHSALGNKTPAEKAGFAPRSENRLLEAINLGSAGPRPSRRRGRLRRR